MNIQKIKRFFIIGVFILFLLCSLEMLIFIVWTSHGNIVNQPDKVALATAEYLYINPLPTPHNLIFPLGDFTIASQFDEICVRIVNGEKYYFDGWSRWYLNGQYVPRSLYEFRRSTLLSDQTGPLITCLIIKGIELNHLNLFKIEFRTSPFYVDISYEWALNIINVTATPIPISIP